MVNRGPSTGCQACRERRVGCDRTKPACRKCTTRGQVCPGYRDTSGVVFKDQSKAVFARHSKRAAASRSTTLPTQLRSDPQDVTTAFFFRQCVLPTRYEWPLGNEYFEYILPLYNSAAPSSLLPIAVSVMALKVATVHHSQDYAQSLVTEAELTAVRAANTALSDRSQCFKDETLLATLCLDFAQQFVRKNSTPKQDRPHLKGALALIRHRGSSSFDSDVSRSLYAATRSHILLHALWSDNESEDQDMVSTLPEVTSTNASVASTIQQILQQVLCLERQVLSVQPGASSSLHNNDKLSSYASRAQILCDRLESYEDEVSWGLKRPDVPLPSGGFERPGDASSIRKAFVFGQYICTNVLALKLRFAATKFAHKDTSQSDVATSLSILARAQGLVDSFCISVIPALDRGQYLVRANDQEMQRMINTETRPELQNGLEDHGLASVSRSHLVCLLTWMMAILMEEIGGAEGFGVSESTLAYLQAMYHGVGFVARGSGQ